LEKLTLEACAKINLTLDVLFKRPDGYHEIEMIMQTISLKDGLSLKLTPRPVIRISSDCPALPQDEANLAYKAAKLMMDEFQLDAGIEIYIDKKIPIAAGLAGGSTDAAAVIVGINEMFQLNLPQAELMALGKKNRCRCAFLHCWRHSLSQGYRRKDHTPKAPVQFRVGIGEPSVFCLHQGSIQ